jgi:hypothetical protein
MSRLTLPLSMLVPALAAATAAAQITLWDFGDQFSSQFGYSLAQVGDLDQDGHRDIAVGAPHGNGAQVDSGYVFLISGKTGLVLSVLNGEKTGDLFGFSVAGIDDADGDGVEDLLVGAPKHETVGTNRGAAYVFSGSTGAQIFKHFGTEDNGELGYSVCRTTDANLDGTDDYALGQPQGDSIQAPDVGLVRLMNGQTFAQLRAFAGENTGDLFGRAIASGGAIKPGVHHSLVIGAPGYDVGTILIGAGKGYVYDALDGSLEYSRNGSGLGTALGSAVASLPDANGDFWREVAFGEPGGDQNGADSGRVVVHSGNGGALLRELLGQAGDRLGAALAGMKDADGDGRGDILAGAPLADYLTLVDCGAARAYSVFTGAVLGSILPAYQNEYIGSAVAAGELNADPFTDLIAGSGFYDGVAPDSGHVRVALGNVPPPTYYCTAKINSSGCVPAIGFFGAPSLSVGDNLHIVAANELEGMNGILIWSQSQASLPFGGGTLCLGSPIERTPVQAPLLGNNLPCLGQFDFHFTNAYMAQFGLTAGSKVYAQYWSRDTGYAAPNNIALTGGLAIELLP